MTRHLRKIELKGIVDVPASKSDAQRALLIAALAKGKSKIGPVGQSDDVIHMLSTIKLLGAQVVQLEGNVLEITGIQQFPKTASITMGESGLGTRLIIPVLAAKGGEFTIEGTGSIQQRPMSFFEEVLPTLGVTVESNNGKLPLRIKGKLKNGSISVDGSSSSQNISGLLISLPLVEGSSTLLVENLKSQPYVEMTLNTMKSFGVSVDHKSLTSFNISGGKEYQATDYLVEGDWSAASCWLVAAALGHQIELRGLSMASKQADRKILDAFLSAGCRIQKTADTLTIDGQNRKALKFDASDCPDLFPALAVYAAMTPGVSHLLGVERLKSKESDRGKAIEEEFSKLGVKVEILGNEMVIHGGTPLNGGIVSSHEDHRISMALGILSTFINEEVQLEGYQSVSKSYPEFWYDFEELIR